MGDLKKKKDIKNKASIDNSDEILIDSQEFVDERRMKLFKEYMKKFYEMQKRKQKNEGKENSMAKYRTYKNGITGHRYKGFYIIKGDTKGKFAIWREDKSVFKDNIYDYDECEWIIDKETADPENLEIINTLYDKEIYELNTLFADLINKRDREGELSSREQNLYTWTEKIRKRKAEDREL